MTETEDVFKACTSELGSLADRYGVDDVVAALSLLVALLAGEEHVAGYRERAKRLHRLSAHLGDAPTVD